MLNSLQQMYYGIRNTNSTRETYSQPLQDKHEMRDSSNGGGPRPLQHTYSRYIGQENYNNMNGQSVSNNNANAVVNANNSVKNRVRFVAHLDNPGGTKQHVVSRNPTSKSQNVSVQHTRTQTEMNRESFSQDKPHNKIGRQAKQDQNPTLGKGSYVKGADSPPSASLTASPDKTTEKKLVNLTLAASKQAKNGGNGVVEKPAVVKRVKIPFKCQECTDRTSFFLKYEFSSDFGSCSACGSFQDHTAI